MFELLSGIVIGSLAMALWCAYRFADACGGVKEALRRIIPFGGGGPGGGTPPR